MKKIRENKPIGAIVHIYMEISQRNSVAIFISKMSNFSFYLFFFLSYKIREQGSRTSPAQGEGLVPVGTGRKRVNMVQ
jgi:hypothetical protein